MIQIKTHCELLFVPIPEGAKGFRVIYKGTHITYSHKCYEVISIPSGNWQIVGTTGECLEDEDKAGLVVEEVFRSDREEWENSVACGDWVNGYRNYEEDALCPQLTFSTISLQSLLIANNITANHLILKKL